MRWMKPARRQFNIYYRLRHDQLEYVPDFVIELRSGLWLAETKMSKEMASAEVIKAFINKATRPSGASR
jgi:type III restriction enzyme